MAKSQPVVTKAKDGKKFNDMYKPSSPKAAKRHNSPRMTKSEKCHNAWFKMHGMKATALIDIV